MLKAKRGHQTIEKLSHLLPLSALFVQYFRQRLSLIPCSNRSVGLLNSFRKRFYPHSVDTVCPFTSIILANADSIVVACGMSLFLL